jgi:acetyl esterase/lipase
MVADYLPGLPAQVRVPATQGPAPLIVMVPGGLWATSDPNMLAPLAARLTADGATTSVLTYSTTATDSRFPVAVNEIACGIRWSVQEANELGYPPTRVVVLGHSAGGQLASLATYSGSEFGGDCPYDEVEINGLIGIAGVYNTDWFASGMSLWMGSTPAEPPDAWAQANPILRVQDGRAPGSIRTLLIHGDADENVPFAQTTALADALRAANMDVNASVFPGLGHMQVIEAGIAEPPIKAWMDSWPS